MWQNNHESPEMVNRKSIPLRSWKTLKRNSSKAVGTNKAKALLRRLDKQEST